MFVNPLVCLVLLLAVVFLLPISILCENMSVSFSLRYLFQQHFRLNCSDLVRDFNEKIFTSRLFVSTLKYGSVEVCLP
jgi:hypothetical protein